MSTEEIYYTKMSPNPDFASSAIDIQIDFELKDPNHLDYDCVEQKIYITDDGESSSDDQFIAKFNIDGSEFEKVLSGLNGK